MAAVAERDAALKQNSASAQELTHLRESSSALQQQLHVLTLEKQAEADKAVKVTTDRKGASQSHSKVIATFTKLFPQQLTELRRKSCLAIHNECIAILCSVMLLRLLHLSNPGMKLSCLEQTDT